MQEIFSLTVWESTSMIVWKWDKDIYQKCEFISKIITFFFIYVLVWESVSARVRVCSCIQWRPFRSDLWRLHIYKTQYFCGISILPRVFSAMQPKMALNLNVVSNHLNRIKCLLISCQNCGRQSWAICCSAAFSTRSFYLFYENVPYDKTGGQYWRHQIIPQ